MPPTTSTKQTPLYLLTTEGCSLCEKAKEQLWDAVSHFSLTLVELDIVDDRDLFERFSVQIPVVTLHNPVPPAKECYLGWPFDREQVYFWLAENLKNRT
ncbi:glutaredoxin family protein [Halioxenophilus sp. WMMB6]|uniref:glutaredoxin family protein n=1 Tax=Halioxenophilus sp. WMMB6 TaxID=3073815 RepID=UPI00295E2581|nr:glutaredoxin family protein [Halioxenophilus sp. WMMB6]